MVKKKKYPPIEPEFSKDRKTVYLDFKVYESIFEEMNDLKEKLKKLKHQKKSSK